MKSDRILLLLDNRGNSRLLGDWLDGNYHAIAADTPAALEQPFDLCITDAISLLRFQQLVRARKQSEPSVFLPFLLVTPRQELSVGVRRFWGVVDELIGVPIEKAELLARVEMLLRTRRLSRQNYELRRVLEADLARAATVQAGLLPYTVPALPGFEIAAQCHPAREVGGDFYDWQEVLSGVLSFTVGDVCGKGMPAALLMATVRTALRAVARRNPPAQSLSLAQEALACDFERSGRFVTLFHAQLDSHNHELRYVDAGHGHVFLRSADGATRRLTPGGMPLGAFAEENYQEGKLSFHTGDALVVYSDGLVEMSHDRALSADELSARLGSAASAAQMVERLTELVPLSGDLADDVTIMVLRRAT